MSTEKKYDLTKEFIELSMDSYNHLNQCVEQSQEKPFNDISSFSMFYEMIFNKLYYDEKK